MTVLKCVAIWSATMIGLMLTASAQAQLTTTPATSTTTTKKVVQEAQHRLQVLGYDPGPPNGVMGSKTTAALKNFQKDHGLAVTGTLDQKTAALLAAPKPSRRGASTSTEETDWADAIKNGTQESYIAFHNKHPNSAKLTVRTGAVKWGGGIHRDPDPPYGYILDSVTIGTYSLSVTVQEALILGLARSDGSRIELVGVDPSHFPPADGIFLFRDGKIVAYQSTAALAQPTTAPKGGYKVEETRLGLLDAEIASPTLSRDGNHLAYIARRGQRSSVVADGQAGTEYDGIGGSPVFSPDGKRVAYAAQSAARWFVVMDGQAGAQYDGIAAMIFSPDGKRVAYVAASAARAKWFVVVDGQPGAEYDGIIKGSLIFSPDGKRVAYAAKLGGKAFLVVNSQIVGTAEYDSIGEGTLIFSVDGKRLAYQAGKGKHQFVVVDGEPGAEYDGIMGSPIFSPDGRRVAYAAQRGTKWLVVVDGQTGAQYDGIGKDSLTFGPDSKRLAYAAIKGAKWLVVVDGEPGAEYDGIMGSPIFSPDGRRVAYAAQRGTKWLVVVDGQPGTEYERISTPVFSPDGKHLAYMEGNGREQTIVVDGQACAEDHVLGKHSPIFGPGGVLEYLAVKEGSLYRVKCLPTP